MQKELKLYKNAYYQGAMSDDSAACILAILEETAMPALYNCIYDMTQEQIIELCALYENHERLNGSVATLIDTFDYTQIAKGKLRDEQTIGTAFMFYAGSCLLGDEVGLGKTVETAGLCNLVRAMHEKQGKPFNFCFLTEMASVDQIRNKMMKFTGRYVGLLPNGEQGTVEKYISRNATGQNYSIVGTHALLNNSDFILYCARHPFTVFIIDESAILKNKGNDIYKNTAALLSRQERRILLNATPLENAVREFYNQLALLDNTYMPTVTRFEQDFCRKERRGQQYEIVGTKNEGMFRQAVKLRYLARTRKGLGAKYDDNTCNVYVIDLCEKQKELLQRTSLYQLTYDYPPDVDINIAKTVENVPKVGVCLNLIKAIRNKYGNDDKIFIYCHYTNCQEMLKETLIANGYSTVILNGKTSAKERKRILTEFNDNKYDIIITNVKRGLDLNICDHCIMYTIDSNPQRMVQAEGRMTRDFDVCGKHLYMLVMKGREERGLVTVLKPRVSMADNLTVTGNSMVMDAIREAGNVQYLGTDTVISLE